MLTRMIFLHKVNCGLFLCSKSLVRFTSNLWYLKIKDSFVTVIYLFACFFFFFFLFYFLIFFSLSVFVKSVQRIDLRSKSNVDGCLNFYLNLHSHVHVTISLIIILFTPTSL